MDDRLKVVASLIASEKHADIGSDHGLLLRYLLRSGRVREAIAIENKNQPFENSQKTLRGMNAEVRFADGMEGLRQGEVQSLSVCGMGGQSIVRILEQVPERLPDRLVIQPNRRENLVREWGLRSGFHVVEERVSCGHWLYQIIVFERNADSTDPAYAGCDLVAGRLFGPLLLAERHPALVKRLEEEETYLAGLPELCGETQWRLDAIRRALRQVRGDSGGQWS